MRSSLFVLSSLLLVGCGGGGSSSPPVQLPPSANVRPEILPIGSPVITENQTAVLNVQARDTDGDQLKFSISGVDADDFVINSSGALSFKTAPNFELSTDDNMDNIYNITVTVSDGRLIASENTVVTVANDREGIRVRRLTTGLNDVTVIATIPSQAKVFVAERGGNIYELDTVDGTRNLDRTLLNVNTAGEGGLLGLTVDPSFSANNTYWAFVTAARSGPFASSGSNISIRKIKRQTIELPSGSGTQLEIPHDSDINYDPYAGASPVFFLAHPANPYVAGGGDRFVYALGLQDPKDGSLFGDGIYFSDRGSSVAEEINYLSHNVGGTNFGWPFFEGSAPATGNTTDPLTVPVTEYGRGSGDRAGSSVVGGAVYNGPIVSLQSKYIFADRNSGKIWAVGLNDLMTGKSVSSSKYEVLNTDFEPDAGSIDGIVAIGKDRENNLILADSDGEIFVVEPSGY